MCVCDVTKMATRRPRGQWRRQQFRGDSCGSYTFSADGRSCTRTRHTQSQRYSSPSAADAAFVVDLTPVPSSPAVLLPCWIFTRPYHPTTTHPGVSRAGSRTGPPLQPLVATVTSRPGYASTACFTAPVPSCHSPQGFQAWAWPAHPYDSFLAYETGPRLLPGSCPTPLWAR